MSEKYKYTGLVDWNAPISEDELRRGPRQASPARQQPRGPVQSTEDPAINSLQRRAAEIDQKIARREQQLKDSFIARGASWLRDISAPDWLGDEGGDALINNLRSTKEGILTDIEDIRRSRQQIADQGGYGAGGFGSALERGLGNAQSMYGALGAMVGDVESDDVSNIIEGRSRTLRAGRGREEQEAYERFQAADGLWASAKELFTNPREMINIAIESLPSSVPSIVGSVVAGGATGIATRNPAAAQRAAAVGGGVGSFVTEYGNAMLETLANNGVDLDSPEALEQAIRDPKIMEEARDRGVKRGLAVGAFDALSIGLAGKLGGGKVASKIIGDTASAGTARRVAGYTAGGLVETGAQGAFGAAGEAAGQLATEGEITGPQDIVAEFAGEIPTGVVESTVGSAIQARRDQNTRPQEDTELAGALSAFAAQRGGQTETLALPDGISQELRDLGDLRVGDLSYTGQQLYSFAENNTSNPRIADIMSQPVSVGTKVQQVARVMNEAEAARVEPEAVRRIAEAVGGTTSVSKTKEIANGVLSQIGDHIIDASPTLSAIRAQVSSDKKGKDFVADLRKITANFTPTAQNQTLTARPYLRTEEAPDGGRQVVEDGSVIMLPTQASEDARQRAEAEQAFRMADRRQERFDRATGTGQQREDLRPGAPEPVGQFFLGEMYGDLAGTPATIVAASTPGRVSVQYETNEVDSSGAPITVSEEMDIADVIGRVNRGDVVARAVRGTSRMSQDLESNLRNPDIDPRTGRRYSGIVGSDMNPRRSVDRTRTRAVTAPDAAGGVSVQNAQQNPTVDELPAIEGTVESPSQVSGAPGARQLPAPPRQLPAPNLTEREQNTPEAQDEGANLPDQEDGGEVDVDNDPRMVEAMDRFDAAIDRVNETENTAQARKLAKQLIREGLIDADAYTDIDERIKDTTENSEKHDEAMAAIEDAIEQQRDNVAADIEEEIYSEADQRAGEGNTRYSGRVERAGRRTVKASEVVARTPLRRETETAAADDAAPDIDYQAVIDDRLSKIEARGAQGRIIAKRLRALLKQSNYNPTQLYYAFQMGEVVSRVLPNAAKIDILFVPSVQASNPNAAAASGIDLGEEAAGSYQAYSISQNGFRGLITLSLSESVLPAARENAAHEAFHVIQDMLQAYDPAAFEQITKAFRDGMTIKDLDPSILRVLKTVRTGERGSVYEGLIADFGDTPLSNFEAQAVAFGALVDAKDRGVPMKGLKASFVRVVDFVRGLFREFGSLLRRDGVRSVADIFEGYRAGTEQEFLNEFGAPLADREGGVQYSGRKGKPPYNHPPIGSQVIAPPITATSTIPFLYNNGKTKTEQTPEERLALKDAVQFIQERSRAALQARFGVDRITGPDPKTDRYLMRAIASEAEAAILKERATGNRSALDWYTKAIEDAIDEASAIYPMLADDDIAVRLSNRLGIASKEDARVMFTTALAITSQNMKVRDNARATTEQFDIFLETGRFDPTKKYGTKAPSISNNLALANFMLERVFDGRVAELGQFLNTEFTVAELNKLGRALQNKEGLEKSPFNISGEMASEKVYGSAIFGPKIGNGFYQNLNRNFSPVTIDLWFMRLWGRLTGTLVGKDTALNKQIEALREAVEADAHPTTKVPDGFAERFNEATDGEVIGLGIELAAEWERQYKALQKQGMTSDEITQQGLKPEWAFKAVALAGQKKPNDAPASGSQRKWIRDVVNGAVKMLAKNGYDVTPADLQALVWYPEKDLVNLLKEGKLEANLNVSYDTAFSELAAIRNADATSANTDAGNRGGDGASRQGDGGRSTGQTAVAGDEALAAGAAQEEGDQVRRTLPTDVRNRLIERGTRYSGRTGRGGRLGGNQGGREIAPLEGAPKNGGGPIADLVQVAEDYALENGIPLTRQAEYVTIDEDFSRRLAQAYEEMQDAPNDPVVREAYRDLIRQTRAQYDALERAGYRFTLFDDDSDPYGTNPWEAMRDLRNNKRMAVYSTVAGYGNEGAQFDVSRNPLLEDTGLRWPDQNGNPRPVLANDLFRAVHDAFGHGLEGAGFRARGEENAWQAHARLFTGPALGALTSETRGQNSWLNFGPYGDNNRAAGLFDTVFAEQKIGLMPEWTWTERVAGGEQASSNRAVYTLERTERIIRDLAYSMDDKKSKGWITFMSPDEFLGLTLSKKGREILATMDPAQTRARPLDLEELRQVDQPLFLDVREAPEISEVQRRLGVTTLPWRVMGHEGRHRMTAFKAAGIEQVPVILRRQDGATQMDVISNISLSPQRGGRSDQYNTGDTSIDVGEAVPVNYANADRIRDMMTGEGVRFSGRRGSFGPSGPPAFRQQRRLAAQGQSPTQRPNAPKFRDGPSLLGADTRSARRAYWESQYERFVNRALPIKQLVKEIGDEFNDSTNFARAEVLMGSVVATQTRDFRNEEIIPLLREISARGLTVEEVETYLHNKHAEERNTVIAGRNELFPDGGSGIATADARRYLASLSDAKRKGLEAVEKKVRTITDGTLQLMVDSGVESPAAVAALRDRYKNWVPLFREGFDGGNPIGGRQRGSSVEGSSLRAAIGSERAVKNIIYNIVSQRESAINRAENNRLSGTVLRAALENPDPAFWMVIDPSKVTLEEIRDQLARMGVDPAIAEEIYKAPRKAAYNKKTGMVESVVDSQFKRAPNVVATRVEGTDKFIVFNPNNELATRVAQAVRNDDMPVLDGLSGKLVEFIGPLTRIWSQMRTQYSPEFGPVNFVRDVENALINLDDTPLSGKQGAVFAKAMKYGNVFRVRNNNLIRVISAADSGRAVSPKDQKLADLFGRFEKAGGRTSIRNTFFQSDDPKKIEAQMQKAFKQIAAGRQSIPAEVASAVTVWNDTLENATRLAIFETAIESGMTDAQAAELAKTTTVNFQQRGQWTRELNAGYGFFNASIAGNSRNIQVMLSKGGKKIALWGVGLGVMQGIMLAMAGYEKDEPPEWVKDNAFIIPIPFTDKYFPIPMLHFYRAFPAIGRRMVETARGQLTVGEFLTGSVRAVVNAVNPLAYGASFIEFAAPSVLDMGVQYWQNLDGLGRRIYNEDFNDLNPTTGMSRARGDMTMMYAMYSKIAEGINAISGGDEFTRGEFSPTPEEIKFFVEETAPPLRFVYRSFGVAEKFFAGDDVEAIELPFLRRFYGERSGKTAEGGKFYENVLELNELRTTIRGRDEAGVDTSDIYEQNPIAELTDSVGSYYRDVSDLRRERRRLILEGGDRAEIRALDEEITALMKEFNDLVAEYREVEE